MPGSSRDLEKKGWGSLKLSQLKVSSQNKSCKGLGTPALESGRSGYRKQRPVEARQLRAGVSKTGAFSQEIRAWPLQHEAVLHHLLFSTDMHDFLRGPICRWASTLSRKKAGLSL